jgi:anti-sigma factor RsiW
VACAESLRLQAYFDGELDGLRAAEVERHLEGCDDCRLLLEDLQRLRSAIRRDLAPAVPAQLRARIAGALDAAAPAAVVPLRAPPRARGRDRSFWLGAFSGVAGSALAAGLLFVLLSPLLGNALMDELVSAHVRSLMPAHLIDVESSDHHTVKPWFAGHADVSPVVADFTPEGYRLIGGRADYLDHQRAAVVVYQHGPHVINVFSWEAKRGGVSKQVTRNGYHMSFWTEGDLQYCAVSDTGWSELEGLTRLLRAQATDERPH